MELTLERRHRLFAPLCLGSNPNIVGELSRKTDANAERSMLGDCYESDIDVSGCLEVVYKRQNTNQGFRPLQWGLALASMHQDRQVFIQELTYK